MATIKIKGMGKIEVADSIARNVKADWSNTNISKETPVDLGEWSGQLGEIIGFLIPPLYQANTRASDAMDENRENSKRFRIQQQNMPLEERSKQLQFFDFLWYSFARTSDKWRSARMEPPAGVHEAAIKAQREFFKQNPKRVVPDPLIFKLIFVKLGLDRMDLHLSGILALKVKTDVREAYYESKN